MRKTLLECVHYWLIKPNDGIESEGICKKCGARKMFRNWLEFSLKSPYDNDPVIQAKMAAKKRWREWSLRK